MNTITDLKRYNVEMSKSLSDKLFWIDFVKPDVVIDFGCANGAVTNTIADILVDSVVIGYDYENTMVKSAHTESTGSPVIYTTSFDYIKKFVDNLDSNKSIAIIFTSVLHEVYSENVESDVWKSVLDINPDFIIIRDMMYRESHPLKWDYQNGTYLHKFADQKQLVEWESEWGSVYDPKSYTHFLLTYPYVVNWNREIKENYFSFDLNSVSDVLTDYKQIYKNHYILPFMKEKVFNDFGEYLLAESIATTHVKAIFQNKKSKMDVFLIDEN